MSITGKFLQEIQNKKRQTNDKKMRRGKRKREKGKKGRREKRQKAKREGERRKVGKWKRRRERWKREGKGKEDRESKRERGKGGGGGEGERGKKKKKKKGATTSDSIQKKSFYDIEVEEWQRNVREISYTRVVEQQKKSNNGIMIQPLTSNCRLRFLYRQHTEQIFQFIVEPQNVKPELLVRFPVL